MRKLLPAMLVLLLLSCNNSKKGSAKAVSKHSPAFNTSVRSSWETYRSLTEAFVNWDSTTVDVQSKELATKLDAITFDEFTAEEKATAIQSLDLAKKDLQAMSEKTGLTEKRRSLNALTQNLYDFFRAVRYDEQKIYLNECPMAFNDEEPGLWLDKTDSIRNPYLGLHHPRYGKGMLDCGDNKSVIDFTNSK